MTSKSIFPRSSFIGFDHMLDELDRLTRHANDHYPPHNIVKYADDHYSIELAVAGFKRDELSIEVNDRTLTVSGEHESKGREVIHRGISTKKFKRSFRLSEHVQVNGADFVDGILSIDLKIVIPETLRPRQIPIGTNEVSHDKSDTKQLLSESN